MQVPETSAEIRGVKLKRTPAAPKSPPPPMEMEGMPSRIKRAMEALDVNQPELAKRSGVAQGTIAKLVNNQSPGVTAAVIARISLALDISADWLLTNAGDIIPQRTPSSNGVTVLDEAHHPLIPRRPGARQRPTSPGSRRRHT